MNGALESFSEALLEYLILFWGNRVPCFIILVLLVQVLAIPAVPLTMSAGLIFGTLYGTILVSISGTVCSHFEEYRFVWRIFESLCNHAFLGCFRLYKNVYPWQTHHIWNVANCSLLLQWHFLSHVIWRGIAYSSWQKTIRSSWQLTKPLVRMVLEWWPCCDWAHCFPSPLETTFTASPLSN